METPTLHWLKQTGTASTDIASAIATDHLGNVFICGHTNGELEAGQGKGESDTFLAKYDSQGSKIWLKQIGTAGTEIASAIATDRLGNVFICGYTEGELEPGQSKGVSDAFFAKYDSQGNQVWLKQVGTNVIDKATTIATDHLGNVFICGYTEGEFEAGQNKGGYDAFLAKYDSQGGPVWLKQIGTARTDIAFAIAIDQGGHIFISGYTHDELEAGQHKGRYDAFLAKYNPEDGSPVWLKQIGTTAHDRAAAIATDHLGNAFISGYTFGELESGQKKGASDAFLAKYDSHGSQIWLKQIGTTADDGAAGIATDHLGNVFISGYTYGELEDGQSQGSADAILAKYDSQGNQVWLKQIGTANKDRAAAVATDHLGNVFISGYTRDELEDGKAKGGPDVFLAKYENIGSSLLTVPLHLKGIYVDKPITTVGPTADFSYLPWNDGKRDYNPDYAPLGEYLETRPLESANGELQPGIHLHWTLPPALCRRIESTSGERVMPYVPVKWNIVPVAQEGTATLTAKTLWSDYLHEEKTPINLKYANVPVPQSETLPIPFTPKHQPFRYMGAATGLGEAFTGATYYSQLTDQPLTCLGYGSLSFAAFYPDCREVFGHYEPLESAEEITSATYFVQATLYKENEDSYPLNKLMNDTGLSLAEVLEQFEWPLLPVAKEITLAGAVKIDTDHSAIDVLQSHPGEVKFSLGNSGTEALSALIATDLADKHGNRSKIEEQLEAILMGDKLVGHEADLGLKFLEARHTHGFRQLPSGSTWSYRIKPTADFLSLEPPNLIGLEPSREPLDEQLIKLNQAQQDYDRQNSKLESMKRALFEDWYKYMLAKYPPPESPKEFDVAHFPESGEAGAWVQSRALKILEQQEKVEVSSLEVDAQKIEMQVILDGINSANYETMLLQHPAEPFNTPADPVVLIADLDIPEPKLKQENPDMQNYVDPTGLDTGTLEEQEKKLFDKLYPDESLIPTNDPWNPFILEWEAEFLPIIDSFGKNAPKNAFTLDENQPEASLIMHEGYKNTQGTTFRGRTFLSPGAKIREMALLGEFLQRNLPPLSTYLEGPTDSNLSQKEQLSLRATGFLANSQKAFDINNAVLTAARAYIELANRTVLSQSLGGFNDALLQLERHLQPPLHDPLGTDEEDRFSRLIGDLIGNESKFGPDPANPFLPARAGSFRLIGLRLIDAWGRYRDLLQEQDFVPALPETLAPFPAKPTWAGLPLRLSQPLRLHFNWLAATTDYGNDISVEELPGVSPIVGWVSANHLDRSLLYFDAQGNALGYYNRNAEQAPPPGVTTGGETPVPALQRVLNHVKDDANYLQAFLNATDNALAGIAPNESLLHPGIAILTGRPMAVVRVRISFELLGIPAQDQSWETLKEHIKNLKYTEPTYQSHWQKMEFPVRLGNYMQLNDGLVGFWLEDENGQHQGPLYTMASSTDSTTILPYTQESLLWLPLDGSAVTLTMLIDPRGSVHATTGVLPIKSIKLRTGHYSKALQRISTWFLNAPLLQPTGAASQFYASPPKESGYRWSWVEAANDHNQPGIEPAWDEVDDFTPAIEKANLQKTAALREGWLKINHETE